ncbi:unnamed protein product, partial [Polarella glacialis]
MPVDRRALRSALGRLRDDGRPRPSRPIVWRWFRLASAGHAPRQVSEVINLVATTFAEAASSELQQPTSEVGDELDEKVHEDRTTSSFCSGLPGEKLQQEVSAPTTPTTTTTTPPTTTPPTTATTTPRDACVELRVRTLDGNLLGTFDVDLGERVQVLIARVQAAMGPGADSGSTGKGRLQLVFGRQVLDVFATLAASGIQSAAELQAVRLPPEPPCLLATADRTTRIWQVGAAGHGRCVRTLDGHTDVVRCVVGICGRGLLASGSMDRTVRIWRISSGACIQMLVGHEDSVQSLASLPEDRIASGSLDRTVRVWCITSGECLWVLQGHESGVLGVTALPGGSMLASASTDRTVRLWSLNSGTCVQVMEGHEGMVRSVVSMVISTAGEEDLALLASSSTDKTLRVWHTNGTCAIVLEDHDAAVLSVAALPGAQLASASADRTVRIWQISTLPGDTAGCTFTLAGRCISVLEGHSAAVLCVASLPSHTLASASLDRTVRIWDTLTGECLQMLGGFSNEVVGVAQIH